MNQTSAVQTEISYEKMVALKLPEQHARFLRTFLGAMSQHDFEKDTPPMNLVRDKFPDYLQYNHDIATSLMEVLGHGMAGMEMPINQEPQISHTYGGCDFDDIPMHKSTDAELIKQGYLLD